MANFTAGVIAIALTMPHGLRPPEKAPSATSVSEREVRATSAKLYSELLRIACMNGWKFSRAQVVAGFNRHFEELRLMLVDRGATIVPLDHVPKLEVTEIVFGLTVPSRDSDRRACYRARWRQDSARSRQIIAPEPRPVAN